MAKLDGTNGLIQQYDYQVLTTAFSYTFAAGTQTLIINPAGTLATGTVTMPAAPADGMVIWITTTQQIVALTVNGNTGQTVVSKVTSLAPNQAVAYLYRSSNTTWYPFETQMAQGNGPVFSACASGSAALTQNTWNKILFGTEIFDTNNNFASSRFTPTVAGYYQFSANINFGAGASVTDSRVSLYKNGSVYVSGTAIGATNSNGTPFTGLGYANGSTDYFEIYAYTGTASTTVYGDGSGPYTTFQGVLVRSA